MIGRARAFLDAIGEGKSAFISRGMVANLDEQLQEVEAELASATGDKNEGLATEGVARRDCSPSRARGSNR